MSWTGKPCDRCAGKKGPNYRTTKFCGKCVIQVRKEQRAKIHETRVGRVYGLLPGDYATVYAFQGGRCAICLRATGKTRRLPVDHDHQTLIFRGLLCGPCNDMLGHGRDDPLFFARVIRYLADPPAVRALGRTVKATPTYPDDGVSPTAVLSAVRRAYPRRRAN